MLPTDLWMNYFRIAAYLVAIWMLRQGETPAWLLKWALSLLR